MLHVPRLTPEKMHYDLGNQLLFQNLWSIKRSCGWEKERRVIAGRSQQIGMG